jgi:hypothetical protein
MLASGKHREVAKAIAAAAHDTAPVLVFDDATGKVLDLDPRTLDIAAPRAAPAKPKPRGRGRPKLGVVAREVTLLPRHWDWLAQQPGSASQVLRRLIDEARKSDTARSRAAHEAAYRFLHAIGGDRPGYEDAIRALFASDYDAFSACLGNWPKDVARYARTLAGIAEANEESGQ